MSIDDIWDSTPDDHGTVFPDLDQDDERGHRARYLQRDRTPGIGYATCYRCGANAAAHIRLRVSSLTPVCRQHMGALAYENVHGELTESGPYRP